MPPPPNPSTPSVPRLTGDDSHEEGGGEERNAIKPYAAIILAAGLSSRMVENKLLLPWTDGEPIISHVLRAYVDAAVDPIIVVTGRDAEGVGDAVAAYGPTLAHNPDFATGEMLSSLKVGLRSLPEGQPAVFIQPGDMPCITGAVIKQLAAARAPGFNVAPLYQGQRGHPVLLDRAFWRVMLDLPADARPRDVIEGAQERLQLVKVDEKGVVLDIDSREAYERGLGLGC
ncbi:MAG: nucleotidyltransferase family protein [Chloroflexi bacterium]|nr:nucleotidyltransferase family protein [Chloroflexota bacterium]